MASMLFKNSGNICYNRKKRKYIKQHIAVNSKNLMQVLITNN